MSFVLIAVTRRRNKHLKKNTIFIKTVPQDVPLTSLCTCESQMNQSVHASSQSHTSNFVSDEEESVVQSDNDNNIERNTVEGSNEHDQQQQQQQTETVCNDDQSLDVRCCDNCH
jgi:hypothetical protein